MTSGAKNEAGLQAKPADIVRGEAKDENAGEGRIDAIDDREELSLSVQREAPWLEVTCSGNQQILNVRL